jgi:hypothetical protein
MARKKAETKISQLKNSFQTNDILELYKIYHDSIEKVAENRQKANSFFLTLNTGILAVIGFLFQKDVSTELRPLHLLLPLAGILSGIFWLKLVISYRQLNRGKFVVLNMIEEFLPFAPYREEWRELEEGKNKKKYHPLTNIEKWIPILFIIVHGLLGFYFIYLFLRAIHVF